MYRNIFRVERQHLFYGASEGLKSVLWQSGYEVNISVKVKFFRELPCIKKILRRVSPSNSLQNIVIQRLRVNTDAVHTILRHPP